MICPHCGKTFSKSSKAKGTESKELISFFIEVTEGSCGFTPEVDGTDHILAAKFLKKSSIDNAKEIIKWYIKSEKAKQVGITLSIALSKHTINLFRQSQISGDRKYEIARALGIPFRGRTDDSNSRGSTILRNIQQEKIIESGRDTDVDEEVKTVSTNGISKTPIIHRTFFK